MSFIEKLHAVVENNYANEKYNVYRFSQVERTLYLKMIDLGINSIYGAILLNNLIYWKFLSRPTRHRGWGRTGGGFLVKGNTHIAINELGEVKLICRDVGGLVNSLRAAKNQEEYVHAVKDKMANELKEMCWTEKPEFCNIFAGGCQVISIPSKDFYEGWNKNCVNILTNEKIEKFNDNVHGKETYSQIKFNYNEYRCVYEFLKGRNKAKIIAKYGQETYDKMIGKKIEDQFLISAIEVMKNEITNLDKERQETITKLRTQCNQEVAALQKKFKDEEHNADTMFRQKIADLDAQLSQMIKGSMSNNEAAD